MATNYVRDDDILELTAPYDCTSGQGALVGSIFGIALAAVKSSATGQFQVEGVWTLPKTTPLAINVGDLVYWDNTNKVVNKTSSAQKLVGAATSAAGSSDTTVNVRLNGAFLS